MMSLSNPSHLSIRAGDEPIPGYRVDSLLERGGFGVVWKCLAPGGLWKAIKFVYGTVGQDRATRELKSLNRIKDAQHPSMPWTTCTNSTVCCIWISSPGTCCCRAVTSRWLTLVY